MFAQSIDSTQTQIQAIRGDHALTDGAIATAVKLFTRTGQFVDPFAEDPALQSALISSAWLLFLAAPTIKPSYLLISSMNLNLVISGERTLEEVFSELRELSERASDNGEDDQNHPQWLANYIELGSGEFSDDEPSQEMAARLEEARTILRENHDSVVEFSRSVIDSLSSDFDQQIQQGTLSPLGEFGDAIDDPEKALTMARSRRDEGDLDAAHYLMDIYLGAFPDDLEVLVERGILRATLEDLQGAVDDFDRAVKLDGDHLIARLNRALALHSLGEVEDAIADYDFALQQVDDDPEIWTNRGIARFSANDYPGAIRDLTKAIELDDTLVPAFLQRGNVRRVVGELGHALKDYARAIQIQPDQAEIYAARGFLYLQMEDTEKAIADFGMAIGLQPSDPTVYYNRAYARLLNQDFDGAIEDYDSALAIDPEDVETLANRGAARMVKGDLEGAVEDWERAININPFYPTPYLKRASMWIATERPEEAARDLRIALDNAPPDWPYKDEVEEALQDLLDELGFDSAN